MEENGNAEDKKRGMGFIRNQLCLLGRKVFDVISDYEWVITSIAFDLFGTIQALVVSTELNKDGGIQQGVWLDVGRLKLSDANSGPVIDFPDFENGVISEGLDDCGRIPLKKESGEEILIVETYLALLGYRVVDLITFYEGVITSISFNLFGRIQAWVVSEKVDVNGKIKEGTWLDVSRLATFSENPLMKSFIVKREKGPANLPLK